MSCGVGRRFGSDPTLLWLQHRPVATAPNGPLAWEPPYVAGAALKDKRQKKKTKKPVYRRHLTQKVLGWLGWWGGGIS